MSLFMKFNDQENNMSVIFKNKYKTYRILTLIHTYIKLIHYTLNQNNQHNQFEHNKSYQINVINYEKFAKIAKKEKYSNKIHFTYIFKIAKVTNLKTDYRQITI